MICCYSCCKPLKLPSCVGIDPESWLTWSHLRYKTKYIELFIVEKKEMNNLLYRYCKFVKFPSCVGIIPES